MSLLHTEKYPGGDGEDYRIRILDDYNKRIVDVNLILDENGPDHREPIVLRVYRPASDSVEEMLEQAKKAIGVFGKFPDTNVEAGIF